MRLFLVRGDLTFGWLQLAADAVWAGQGGTAVSEPWVEPMLEPLGEGDHDFIPVDCFSLNVGSSELVLSDYARSSLATLLDGAGEFWPVRVREHQYWWFNCLACVDALDRGHTDAEWGNVSGAWGSFRWITRTRRLAFDPARLMSTPGLFRLPEYPQGIVFGRESLQAAAGDGLTGMSFDLMWSAAEGGVNDPPGLSFGGAGLPESQAEARRRRERARRMLDVRGKQERRS